MPSVAVCGDASTYLSLKMLRPLFSIAPMLKSDTATMLNTSRYIRAQSLLVPTHRALQRVHGVIGARLLAVFDMDGELHLAPEA